MEPLMVRDRRYWLQKQIGNLDAEADAERIVELEEQIEALQEICPHEHDEEVPDDNLWHCRDCDLRRPLDPDAADSEEPEDEAVAAEGEAETE